MSVMVVLAVAVPNAFALDGGGAPVDIGQVAQDVINGTATPTETYEWQAFVDWVSLNAGATNPIPYQLTQNFTNDASAPGGWTSADPDYQALLQAEESMASGSSQDTAIGSELLATEEAGGFLPTVGKFVSSLCTDVWPCALGAIDALVVGNDVVSIFDCCGGTDSSALANEGGALAPENEAKVWAVPTPCISGWSALKDGRNSGVAGASPGSYWGMFNSGPGGPINYPSIQCSGTGTPNVGPDGGVWLMAQQWTGTRTAASPGTGWYGSVEGAFQTGPGQGCTNGLHWEPPFSTYDGWTVGIAGDTNNAQCADVMGGNPPSYDTFAEEWSYKTTNQLKVGTPKVGPCNGSCATIQPNSGPYAGVPNTIAAAIQDPSNQNLRTWINHANGTGAQAPGTAAVPQSCIGATPAACKSALTSAGFINPPVENTLTAPQADLTKPAGAVVTTDPGPGAYVDTSTVVKLSENPSPLPLAIPQPLKGGETYQAYITRLQDLGITGKITEQDVTDANIDPAVGPQDVVRTSPAVGTLVEPSTDVTVYANPSDAAPGGGGGSGGGGPVGPTLPGVDLPNVPTPCTVFPFGAPCWVGNALGSWSSTAQPWQFDFPLQNPVTGASSHIHIDLGILQPALDYIRPLLLVAATLLIGWAFFSMAMGGRGPGGGAGGDDE